MFFLKASTLPRMFRLALSMVPLIMTPYPQSQPRLQARPSLVHLPELSSLEGGAEIAEGSVFSSPGGGIL